MKTVGEFLTECGARLAPFERRKIGKIGCTFSLIAMGLAILAIAAGLRDTGGSLAAGFRFVVLCGLGTVIVLYLFYALVEVIVESSVWRGLQSFMAESQTDLETLVKAAEMRAGHIAGGTRLVALLKERAPRR